MGMKFMLSNLVIPNRVEPQSYVANFFCYVTGLGINYNNNQDFVSALVTVETHHLRELM
jgi:hypothetical protein